MITIPFNLKLQEEEIKKREALEKIMLDNQQKIEDAQRKLVSRLFPIAAGG